MTSRKPPAEPPRPTFTLDARELWAAAARAGLDPVTAKAIAAHIGVQEATLSRVLAGKRPPPRTMLAAIAVAFPTSYTRIAKPPSPDGHRPR